MSLKTTGTVLLAQYIQAAKRQGIAAEEAIVNSVANALLAIKATTTDLRT